MKKILSLTKYALLAIGLISLISILISGEGGVEFMLIWAYILVGIAIVAAVLFPLLNIAQNPKGAARSLIGLGILIVILVITYAMSSADPIVTAVDIYDNPTELKLTDTGLYTTYFALAAAIIVAIFGEIRNSFK